MIRMEMDTWREGPEMLPDIRRVLLRPFVPGDDARTRGILKRVAAISDTEAEKLLADVRSEFAGRHRDLETA